MSEKELHYDPIEDPDPTGLGEQKAIMETLVKALELEEDPTRDRIRQVLERTMDVDIPKPVREYISKILRDNSNRQVGNPAFSLLDMFFIKPCDPKVFRDVSIKNAYARLRNEEGLSSQEAFNKLADQFKHCFPNKPKTSTIRKIVYTK